jgi:hypothetical protein
MAAAQSAGYAAKVAQQNKELTKEAASDEIKQGYDQREQLGEDIAKQVGSQKARMSANNIDIGFGNAAMVIDDTLTTGEDDQKALNENINRRVKGFQVDAWNFESETRAQLANKKNAKIATGFNMASTALGGATSYAKYKEG